MLRTVLISLSKATWAKNLMTSWSFARKNSSRFVAGETSTDALRIAMNLNQSGIKVSLDHLGENTEDREHARQATDEILKVLEEIEAVGAQANVSVKLTQIGLSLDPDFCLENLEAILSKARQYQNFIRIDMEGSGLTDQTIEMYTRMRQLNYENIGVVLQAYLYRSSNDIQQLSSVGPRIRLCKGAYREPAQIAFPQKADVDRNFDQLMEQLMKIAIQAGSPPVSSDGKIPPIPAIATHDPVRIARVKNVSEQIGLSKKAFEFQMLYGIRRDLQQQLVKEGYLVRVYVPYGTHWYPYFMRRLAERPANLWFFMGNIFRP